MKSNGVTSRRSPVLSLADGEKNMKFDVGVTKRETVTIDVEFPLYLEGGDSFDGGRYENYSRIDADLTEHRITVNPKREWVYQVARLSTYHLGEMLIGGSKCKNIGAAEFYAKVAEFKRILDAIPADDGTGRSL